MKYIRDKDTGEVCELDFDSKEGVFIVISYNDGITKKTTYNNLDDLTKYWEDYKQEEPQPFWYLDYDGATYFEKYPIEEEIEDAKAIGNYFKTEEDAKKAKESLKAWLILKENGFTFTGWKRNIDKPHTIRIEAEWRATRTYHPPKEIANALKLLFGGGDE